MKSTISKFWLFERVAYIGAAGLCYSVAPLPGLALVVISLQTLLHEFVHGLSVSWVNGTIDEISLTAHPFIDFTVSDNHQKRFVYFSGFVFELGCISLAGWLLINSGGWVFPLMGCALILMGAAYSTWPADSDYNQWRKYK
jgi:hypothetical protein